MITMRSYQPKTTQKKEHSSALFNINIPMI